MTATTRLTTTTPKEFLELLFAVKNTYHFDTPLDICTFWPSWTCSRPPRSTSLTWKPYLCYALHWLCNDMLIILIPHMTYLHWALNVLDMSVATKITFLNLRTLCVLCIAYAFLGHAEQFDISFDLLIYPKFPQVQNYTVFDSHGHVRLVRDHPDHLLGLGQLDLFDNRLREVIDDHNNY